MSLVALRRATRPPGRSNIGNGQNRQLENIRQRVGISRRWSPVNVRVGLLGLFYHPLPGTRLSLLHQGPLVVGQNVYAMAVYVTMCKCCKPLLSALFTLQDDSTEHFQESAVTRMDQSAWNHLNLLLARLQFRVTLCDHSTLRSAPEV